MDSRQPALVGWSYGLGTNVAPFPSGHNLRVGTQQHHGNRCPNELRICNKCDWHTVQDGKHVILDCPSQDLTELRCLPCFSQSELRGGWVIRSVHQCGPLSLMDVGSVSLPT
eukprot:1155172-Pelagomonas_calceolata.AAC.1